MSATKSGLDRRLILVLIWSISFECLLAQEVPVGFVDVKVYIPSVILDLRYYGSHNFIGDTIDGYKCNKCYLTRQAADSLKKVQQILLKSGFSLKIYDCYRPQKAVDHFVRWARNINDTLMKREFYPTVEKKNLFRDGYIAEKSGHSRGSTVDLTIVELPVKEQEKYIHGMKLSECYKRFEDRFRDNSIDMGTGFDCFGKSAHTLNSDLEPQFRLNRLLLKTLMEKYGFRNLPEEWWHFTLINEPYPDTYFNFLIE